MTQYRSFANGPAARVLAGVVAIAVFGGIALYASQGYLVPLSTESSALPYADPHPIDRCMAQKRQSVTRKLESGEYGETEAERAMAGIGNACAAEWGSEHPSLARGPRWGAWHGAARTTL
jgi:hypothetical protein